MSRLYHFDDFDFFADASAMDNSELEYAAKQAIKYVHTAMKGQKGYELRTFKKKKVKAPDNEHESWMEVFEVKKDNKSVLYFSMDDNKIYLFDENTNWKDKEITAKEIQEIHNDSEMETSDLIELSMALSSFDEYEDFTFYSLGEDIDPNCSGAKGLTMAAGINQDILYKAGIHSPRIDVVGKTDIEGKSACMLKVSKGSRHNPEVTGAYYITDDKQVYLSNLYPVYKTDIPKDAAEPKAGEETEEDKAAKKSIEKYGGSMTKYEKFTLMVPPSDNKIPLPNWDEMPQSVAANYIIEHALPEHLSKTSKIIRSISVGKVKYDMILEPTLMDKTQIDASKNVAAVLKIVKIHDQDAYLFKTVYGGGTYAAVTKDRKIYLFEPAITKVGQQPNDVQPKEIPDIGEKMKMEEEGIYFDTNQNISGYNIDAPFKLYQVKPDDNDSEAAAKFEKMSSLSIEKAAKSVYDKYILNYQGSFNNNYWFIINTDVDEKDGEMSYVFVVGQGLDSGRDIKQYFETWVTVSGKVGDMAPVSKSKTKLEEEAERERKLREAEMNAQKARDSALLQKKLEKEI